MRGEAASSAGDGARSGDRPCPCHSGRKYKRCCQPWHQGRPAPSPRDLMRSRFSGYALGLVDYIVDTTDPSGPQWGADLPGWREQIRRFCRDTRLRDLRVLHAAHDGDEGIVEFRCLLLAGERQAEMAERSHFRRVDGRWLYHSGEALD